MLALTREGRILYRWRGWVALGLLAWAALVAPGIVEMHRAFQSVEP